MNTNYLWSLLSLLLVIGLSMPDQASGTPISLPGHLTGAGATWSGVGGVRFGVGSGVVLDRESATRTSAANSMPSIVR